MSTEWLQPVRAPWYVCCRALRLETMQHPGLTLALHIPCPAGHATNLPRPHLVSWKHLTLK